MKKIKSFNLLIEKDFFKNDNFNSFEIVFDIEFFLSQFKHVSFFLIFCYYSTIQTNECRINIEFKFEFFVFVVFIVVYFLKFFRFCSI